jgi:pilus assembly protein CpaC
MNSRQVSAVSLTKLRRLLTASLMVVTASAGLSVAPGLPGLSAAHARTVNTVTAHQASQRLALGLNKSIVIDLPQDAYDILVANPSVADAVTRTARRIYLFGKQVGETNIFVFGSNGEQIASLELRVERDVTGLDAHLKRFLPNASIRSELINDNVILTGTVDTPLDSKRAEELARMFVSGGEATTGQYSQTAVGGAAAGGVGINNPDSSRRSSSIVNMLQVVGEDQVTLKVTVAEVSRTVLKQLGVNMIGQGSVDGISWGVNSLLAPAGAPSASLAGSLLSSSISAMEQSGVMRTLAEPTLTAVSGEQATFRVGGEYNIIANVTNDEGRTVRSLEKIEYGIGLDFLPVVLSPGRISLKVRTAVSEPTPEGAVQVEGQNILSLRKRLADTTVELPSGGTMMIAGLVNDNVRQVYNKVPGLGQVPVLGALFRSREFTRNETELVILITPYLSRPAARTAMAKPDDNFTPASDGAGMFLGRVNRVYGTMQTDKPAGRYHGAVGFIYK